MNVFTYTGVASAAVICWEHAARINSWKYRPSAGLTAVADNAIIFWKLVGKSIAKISSFYNFLRIYELMTTIYDLVTPILKTIFSPIWMLKGYIDQSGAYDHRWLVGLGTVTILVLIGGGVWYRYPWIVNSIVAHKSPIGMGAFGIFLGGFLWVVNDPLFFQR